MFIVVIVAILLFIIFLLIRKIKKLKEIIGKFRRSNREVSVCVGYLLEKSWKHVSNIEKNSY
ncbi:hypothetical protein FAD87_RS09420 [Enterococcus hirae]